MKMTTEIPDGITTPDNIETQLGDLNFFDGVPDAKSNEAVKIFVVREPNAEISKDDLIAYCRENLTGYKVPRHVEFRDELPKTNVGKILRRELRES